MDSTYGKKFGYHDSNLITHYFQLELQNENLISCQTNEIQKCPFNVTFTVKTSFILKFKSKLSGSLFRNEYFNISFQMFFFVQLFFSIPFFHYKSQFKSQKQRKETEKLCACNFISIKKWFFFATFFSSSDVHDFHLFVGFFSL